ncbi:NfeD family protein [Pseudodonghicola xiamenensis]|uniref:NfeD-like C-terminal, partner-binding n=1 Tax=Pseudodonghicola xiamenensis TaxID=337702 RepID=A0A8J3MC20_9RHOB|nr:hypothetical protein [Pseudodonghicola xiamenensis]GHG87008.1 hypothetical protein GCM10010961_15060 [Pseudodonghicola xiamenensis]
MLLWTLWWVWMAAALGLAILEVLVPGFVFLGFALGALGVGLLLLLVDVLALAPLLLIFALLSLTAWLVMRRLFSLPKGQVKIIDRDINDD